MNQITSPRFEEMRNSSQTSSIAKKPEKPYMADGDNVSITEILPMEGSSEMRRNFTNSLISAVSGHKD